MTDLWAPYAVGRFHSVYEFKLLCAPCDVDENA